ncbi:MAG: SpoIIIAH-like family protein [Oscillibacter sp.]|nr:SpoIIIAH-like family protein [Oscillibacter sp.]MBQ2996211.1 SpoIIIAH-like family protein [Oscillibacter sp.]
MGAKWKRNTAVAAMVLLVCAAVGMNWRYTAQQGQQAVEEANGRILGEAELVSNQTGETDVAGDYFASARLTRQQARDSAMALLQQAAEQEGAEQTVIDEAAESIQVLAANTLQEAQIENLVTAKGYADCVAFMSDGSLSIVVSCEGGELQGADVARITDIAMTESGLPASAIRIMAAK